MTVAVVVLLLVAVPSVELFLLLQLGALIGPTPTFLLLLGSALLGAWLAKREGLDVVRQLSDELRQGLPPGDRLMEGALVVLGGLLLVIPGILTDLVGLVLLLPPARRRIAPVAMRWVSARLGLELGPGRETDEVPGGEGVRYRTAETVFRAEPRRTTPFSSPFDD